MKVKDILDLINESNSTYELVMSCMTSEYTKEHPKSSNVGYLYLDCGDVTFDIDWTDKAKTFVNELYTYDEEMGIISWDTDDGNMIEFKEVFISDVDKLVILI